MSKSRKRGWQSVLGPVLGVAVFLVCSCSGGDIVLHDQVILTISASPSTIVNHGDTAIITVRATEPDGRPVLDGARIQFTATGGSIPSEVTTIDGVAIAPFISDASLGTFTITAQSGSLGADGSVSTMVTVVDRNVEIGSATLSLNPSNLSSAGGRVDVRLVVTDQAGLPLPNKTVVFSSDYGRLQSNGTARFTDSAGQAQDVLDLDPLPPTVTQVTLNAQVATTSVMQMLTVTPNDNPLPVIVFSPSSPRAGETVFFNGSDSTDPDGFIQTYEWQFGDGEISSGEQVSHAYENAKEFRVTLKVTDNLGASVSTTESIVIGTNTLPTASFSVSPSNPRVNQVIVFNAGASQDPDGTIVAYDWTLGNGIERQGETVSFAYSGASTYIVTLTVTDDSGGRASTSESIAVSGNQNPSAQFTVSPTNPRVGSNVSFDGTGSTDSDGSVTSYTWSFGDGFTGTGEIVTWGYTDPGTYRVQLTVRDNDGGIGTATQNVTVSDTNPPQAAFTFTPLSPRVNETVLFDASGSSDSDGQITFYSWSFGSGATGNGRITQHRYSAPGDYQVGLTVRDNDGRQDSVTQIVTVGSGGIPDAILVIEPQVLTPPGGEVLLDGSQTTDMEDNLARLLFDFEAFAPDNATVTIPSGQGPIRLASIEDAELGDQIVFHMRATDRQGNVGLSTQVVTIGTSTTNQRPVASFTVTPSQLQIPGGDVILDGSETSDPDHLLSELNFDYSFQVAGQVSVVVQGGGPLQTATLNNGGTSDVVTFLLTVTDPLGLQDAVTQSVSLTEAPSNSAPVASLTSLPANSVTVPNPPTAPVGITLDARGSTDLETPNDLVFVFAGDSSDPSDILIQIDANSQVPALAVANVTGIEAGDQLIFSVIVRDPAGADDQAAIILQVVDP